ncbi:MAG: RNB domain-containing ribonuclease [Deltaproteobacteria bacterium]|nr:RNB domain-containing ribonuclease [Deltaproteobacteria bacterium]
MTELVPDRLALVAVHGELVPVRIVGRADRRVIIEDAASGERSVSPARLFWAGRTEVGDLAALAERWGAISARADGADLFGAWKALGDETTAVDVGDLAALAFQDDSAEARDAALVAIFRDNLCFRVRGGQVSREASAVVEQTRAKRAAEAQAARELAMAKDAVLAALGGGALPPEPGPDAPAEARERHDAVEGYLEALADYAVSGTDAARSADAERLLAAVGRAKEDAFRVLVALGRFTPDENLALRRAGIRRAFPPAAVAEARAVAAGLPTGRTRDLRDLVTVAIDDATTTEVDDAVAVDGARIIVFIADAAAFVPPRSALDQEALARVSTLYLPEGKIPMLPPEVGSGCASLRADHERTALAFSFEVADDGRLVTFELERALIRVDRQLDYDGTDAILGAPEGEDALSRTLHRVQAAMDRHRERRRRRGAMFLQRTEVYLEVGADGRVTPRPGDPYGLGRQLISELMIATCAGAAEFCIDRQIPSIFRTQASPDGGDFGGSGQRVDDPAAQNELLRRLKPTVLSTNPGRHFTLGVEAYCQLTSPLRRYADLLMHQQLAGWLKTGRTPFTAGALSGRFPEIERRAALVKRVEAESRRYWSLRYLEQNPGLELVARPVREAGRRWIVELPELAIQVPMALSPRPRVGEVLTVRVAKVDARADKLVLEA